MLTLSNGYGELLDNYSSDADVLQCWHRQHLLCNLGIDLIISIDHWQSSASPSVMTFLSVSQQQLASSNMTYLHPQHTCKAKLTGRLLGLRLAIAVNMNKSVTGK